MESTPRSCPLYPGVTCDCCPESLAASGLSHADLNVKSLVGRQIVRTLGSCGILIVLPEITRSRDHLMIEAKEAQHSRSHNKKDSLEFSLSGAKVFEKLSFFAGLAALEGGTCSSTWIPLTNWDNVGIERASEWRQ